MGHPLELGPYRGLRPLGLAAGASRFTPGLDNPSTIEAQAVLVSLDPLRSLLTRSWVLQFQIDRARVDLRRNSQGSFWQLGRVPAGGQPPPLTLRYGLSGGPAQVRIHGARVSRRPWRWRDPCRLICAGVVWIPTLSCAAVRGGS
jgi:translocation and assembly module TamB